MKKLLSIFFLFLGLFLLGCTPPGSQSKLSAVSVQGAALNKSGKFYVVRFEPDKRYLNMIIAEQLALMGFNVTAGEKSDMPEDIDTVVTYIDQWRWDMANYMTEIDIQFREADGALIMTGESSRKTLVRRAPEIMIKETLQEMIK